MIHIFFRSPFELTNEEVRIPKDVSFLTKLRFKLGRSSTANRLKKLLIILKEGFEFVTFLNLKS